MRAGLAMARTKTVRHYEEVAGASQVDLKVPGSHGIDSLELWSLRATDSRVYTRLDVWATLQGVCSNQYLQLHSLTSSQGSGGGKLFWRLCADMDLGVCVQEAWAGRD